MIPVNDSLRGKTEDTIAGMDALEETGVKFSVGIMPTSQNITSINDTVKLLLKYQNLVLLNLEQLQPAMGINCTEFERMSLNNTSSNKLRTDVKTIIAESGRRDVQLVSIDNALCPNGSMLDSFGFKTCMAGILRAGVFANGDVTPLPTSQGYYVGERLQGSVGNNMEQK